MPIARGSRLSTTWSFAAKRQPGDGRRRARNGSTRSTAVPATRSASCDTKPSPVCGSPHFSMSRPTWGAKKVPVSLAVNGHETAGKSIEYKQLRCINQAKRGMIVLNTEYLGMGQLTGQNYSHYRMNQLDLCGTSGLAPFYLVMSRGLDILLAREHADPARVTVQGLSGGGWQTITISSLDTRVTLCNPVAGYSSLRTRVRNVTDLGDSEQNAADLETIVDYAQMTAMLAPDRHS